MTTIRDIFGNNSRSGPIPHEQVLNEDFVPSLDDACLRIDEIAAIIRRTREPILEGDNTKVVGAWYDLSKAAAELAAIAVLLSSLGLPITSENQSLAPSYDYDHDPFEKDPKLKK